MSLAATVTVADVLRTGALHASEVWAGATGLDRPVRSVDLLELTDARPFARADQLLFAAGPAALDAAACDLRRVAELIGTLSSTGVAGLAVRADGRDGGLARHVVEAAERSAFPIIGLPAEVRLGAVMSDVLALLHDRHTTADSRADRLHRALQDIALAGGELPEVSAELARFLGAAVLVTTPDGRVLTSAGPAAEVDRLLGQPLFDGTGRLQVERVVDGTAALGRVVGDPTAPGQLAAAPVLAGGLEHGRVIAFTATPGGFDGYPLDILERAAGVIAFGLTRQIAVHAVESKYRGDFLRDALTGAAGDPDVVRDHCVSLGWNVERPLVVVVAALDSPETPDTVPLVPGRAFPMRSTQERFAAAWEQVAHGRDKSMPVVGLHNEVVCLVPVDDPAGARDTVADLVASVAGDRGGGRRSFGTGVSRVVEGPADWPRGYRQARKAVAIGRRVHGPGATTHFDALGVHRLLSLVPDPAELRGFADEVLGELARDTAEMLDLRLTLQTLLDTNLNVAETARVLHFHYNTLRYRIGKLERLVGPFTTDPHLRLDVALALQVVQMAGL